MGCGKAAGENDVHTRKLIATFYANCTNYRVEPYVTQLNMLLINKCCDC